jgi:hypothetical protein
MSLTPQLFSQVLGRLRAPADATGREKRRATRCEVSGKIELAVLSKNAAAHRFFVLGRDLSMGGMGVLSSIAIAKGQPFLAILPREKIGPVYVFCEATHCGLAADGIYTIGCRFMRLISAEAFEKLQTAAIDLTRAREAVLA